LDSRHEEEEEERKARGRTERLAQLGVQGLESFTISWELNWQEKELSLKLHLNEILRIFDCLHNEENVSKPILSNQLLRWLNGNEPA